MEKQGKKVVVWNLDYNIEINIAKKNGFDLFPEYQLKGPDDLHEKNSSNFNVVFFQHFLINNDITRKKDLSWADLVIHYTSELLFGPWEVYQIAIKESVQNKNVVSVCSGFRDMDYYPEDKCFPYLQHFFTITADSFNKIKIKHKSVRKKKFDVLMGRSKPHRLFVFDSLQKNHMLNQCFVNITKDSTNNSGITFRSADIDLYEDQNILPMIDHDDNYSRNINGLANGYTISQHIPVGIFDNSWFSIIAETNWNKSTFFSEKTAKAMLAKRVFVLFGSQGQLALLRKLGYRTFGDIIDESYDLEENDHERWKKAFSQVLFLYNSDPVRIYEKSLAIIEHNRRILLDQTKRFRSLSKFLNSVINKKVGK